MTVEKINVTAALEKAKKVLAQDKNISAATASVFELLMTIVVLLMNRLNVNSRNSSKPPSQDPNRPRRARKDKGEKRGKRRPGGQNGHPGATLKPVDKPDEVEQILIDRRTIPPGNYTEVGFEKRQVFDMNVSVCVTEYQAEILENEMGHQYVANFPEGVTNPTQYGDGIKAQSVYLSQFQLIPLARVSDHFNHQLHIPVAKGSVSNFNKAASQKLDVFEAWAKTKLLRSALNHADETGVNVNGKRLWFHLLSNKEVALYEVDEKRGKEAMDRMGVLPHYKGILCHDHWKPYYRYPCRHSLCNAHHIRELERAWEEDGQKWANRMQQLLLEINERVRKSKKQRLSAKSVKAYEEQYRTLLTQGEKECPWQEERKTKRGRVQQSPSRNLLERLKNYEEDVLRFMKESEVPFTNNRAENDLRMTKVQQKISGCFRSLEGAKIFCRIRSYLVTCRKNGVKPTHALRLLFEGKFPDFMKTT